MKVERKKTKSKYIQKKQSTEIQPEEKRLLMKEET